MELIIIPKEAWAPILKKLRFVIRQDGLICTPVPLATDTKNTLIPLKCMYCRSVLHLRNINYLERNKAVCKNYVCMLQWAMEDDEL